MKKFRNVPAIITLAAGSVTSILMIINRITIVTYLWTLAIVMFGFYFVGLIVRFILNKVFKDPEVKENSEESNDENSEETGEDTVEDNSIEDGAQ